MKQQSITHFVTAIIASCHGNSASSPGNILVWYKIRQALLLQQPKH